MSNAEPSTSPRVQFFTLSPEHELRVEADEGPVFLTLKSGTGEVFGCDVAVNQRVALSHQKVALFSWSGATVELEGDCDIAYVASDTPMASYVNVHGVLEQRRKAAKAAGPSVCAPSPPSRVR
jgi:polyribonucleotide 5'-hydroxyl-kinase